MTETPHAIQVAPGSFEPEHHYYPRVLNAHLHPVVRHFRSLSKDQIAARYCHLHPEASPEMVAEVLGGVPKYFRWAGADLFHATSDKGIRQNLIVETNSSPSGQKSMPFDDEHDQGGYRALIEKSFLPLLKRRKLPKGDLAVVADKNPMETKGYAAVIAELTGEKVWWAPFHNIEERCVRFDEGVLQVRDAEGQWHPIRAAFRYVTQRPWNRIPPLTKTAFLNPVLSCLAGGRNKLVAAKAYDFFNASMREHGLTVRTPETIWDVQKAEVPLWVERMGGVAVVKVPYSNAGQGVYTITSPAELEAFMNEEHTYDLFIVQALVGNNEWSSTTRHGKLYHVGTVPNKKGHIYAADLRFMVGVGVDGFYPIAIYSRRAREPLEQKLQSGKSSWAMLGTNLSIKQDTGEWGSEPERLLLVDSRDFNRLGIGLDDLTEAYIQTVLAVTAIDQMAQRLINSKGGFRRRLFQTLNPDPKFAEDMMV